MKKLIFTLILSLFLSNGYSQVTGAAALVALDELDASVTKQIQSLDNLATNAIGNAGNMLLSVSARLRKDINETIGNTDKMLRENQLLLFNQIQNLASDLDRTIKENIDNVDVVASRISVTMDNFLIKKKEPYIFKYDTETFIKDHSKYYTFKVKGKNFDQTEQTYIQLNNKKIKPIQISYNEMVFRIDSSDIHFSGENMYYSQAKIVFHWKKGLFNSKKEKKEPFLIPISPLNIGELTVFYEQKLPEKKLSNYISYSCNCSTGSTGWDGDSKKGKKAFNIIPTGGRLFDTSTIVVDSWTQRYGGNYGFDHRTEQQIKGEISCKSQSRPFGGGGFSSLTFKYKEFEIVYPTHKKQTALHKITSINPLIVELPDPVDSNRPNVSHAIIKTFDNREIVLSPTKTDKLFDLRINTVTDDVVISWKRIL